MAHVFKCRGHVVKFHSFQWVRSVSRGAYALWCLITMHTLSLSEFRKVNTWTEDREWMHDRSVIKRRWCDVKTGPVSSGRRVLLKYLLVGSFCRQGSCETQNCLGSVWFKQVRGKAGRVDICRSRSFADLRQITSPLPLSPPSLRLLRKKECKTINVPA